MFRRIKVPEREEHTFDQSVYEEQLLWLQKKKDGELAISVSPIEWVYLIGMSVFLSILIGGSIGALFGALFQNIYILIYSPLIVYIISFFILKKPSAIFEIDVDRGIIDYEGIIIFGGEHRSGRYHGPYQVIEGVQLGLKGWLNRPNLRFHTNSGYFIANYRPKTEKTFLDALETLGIINIDQFNHILAEKKVLRKIKSWKILYEQKFDRTEFKAELKQQKNKRKQKEEEEKRALRERLLKKKQKNIKNKI